MTAKIPTEKGREPEVVPGVVEAEDADQRIGIGGDALHASLRADESSDDAEVDDAKDHCHETVIVALQLEESVAGNHGVDEDHEDAVGGERLPDVFADGDEGVVPMEDVLDAGHVGTKEREFFRCVGVLGDS